MCLILKSINFQINESVSNQMCFTYLVEWRESFVSWASRWEFYLKPQSLLAGNRGRHLNRKNNKQQEISSLFYCVWPGLQCRSARTKWFGFIWALHLAIEMSWDSPSKRSYALKFNFSGTYDGRDTLTVAHSE